MRRALVVVFVMVMGLSVTSTMASADPTHAHNYEAIPATCDELGEIVIEVTNVGHWGAGKVQGTTLTLLPRYFHTVATLQGTGEVLFEEATEMRHAAVDDACTFSFVEEVPPGDPLLPDGGTLLVEITVGVRVVGR